MGTIYHMHNKTDADQKQGPNPNQEISDPSPGSEEKPGNSYNDLNFLIPDLSEDWSMKQRSDSNFNTDENRTSIITVFPKPIIPCYFCDSNEYGLVRILNAAAGYGPFIVYMNNQLIVDRLDNGDMTQYGRVSASMQTISLTGEYGYLYLEKQINVPLDKAITVAIINTNEGLDIMEIEDAFCDGGINTGCFRVCNFSITNQNVAVILNGGALSFNEVDYKEITDFQYLKTGFYLVSIMDSDAGGSYILLSSNLYIRGNASYTLYVFNWSIAKDALRILIVEDRRDS